MRRSGSGEALPAPAGSFGQMLVGGMTASVLLLTAGLAFVSYGPGSGGEETGVDAVLGMNETRPVPVPTPEATAPPVTATTQDPAAAFAALLAKRSTTTTAPPPTTTTTVRPAPIATASATTTAPGVTLALDVTPADGIRALRARLSVRVDGARVLRRVRVDFGDGTVRPGEVPPWECGSTGVANPYDVQWPAHTYRSSAAYVVTVVATTATCSPDDDDWGPEESSEVHLGIAAP